MGLPDPEPATTSDAVDDDRSRMPQSGDPVIDKTREAAFAFTDTLPNYVVKQFTTRYATRNASGRGNNWQALDNVSTDVVYENGKESYKNFQINGKACASFLRKRPAPGRPVSSPQSCRPLFRARKRCGVP